MKDLGLDSLDQVEIIMAMEDEFGEWVESMQQLGNLSVDGLDRSDVRVKPRMLLQIVVENLHVFKKREIKK